MTDLPDHRPSTLQATRRVSPIAALVLTVAIPLLVVYSGLWISKVVYRPLSDNGNALYILTQFATSAAICLGGLAVWPGRLRSYAIVAGGGLAALALLNLVHVFEYSELVTIGAIDATLSTTGREAGEFLIGRPVSAALAAGATLVTALAMIWSIRQIPSQTRVTRSSRVGLGLLGVVGLAVLVLYPMRLFPVSTVKNAADYALYRAEMERAIDQRADHSFEVTGTADWSEPPVLVVVMGESLRRDHLGIYGYERDTSPRLGGLDSLVVFSDVVTAAPVTQPAVYAALTSATADNIATHADGSWITLAEETGYHSVWISNQDRTDGTSTALLAEDADHLVYTSHSWSASGQLDQDVLPHVEQALANRDRPLALVVHLIGNHDDYALRYPDRFDRFGPSDPMDRADLDGAERALVDHYDNSVLYTDWVVSEIVDRVRTTGAPAAVVFLSDHGENLYDTPDRMRGHGVPGTTRFEVDVPFVVWTSESLRAERPGLVEALYRNSDLPVTTANLFFGLADVMGATWDDADPTRSVFNSAYVPGPRRVLTPTYDVVDAESLGPNVASNQRH